MGEGKPLEMGENHLEEIMTYRSDLEGNLVEVVAYKLTRQPYVHIYIIYIYNSSFIINLLTIISEEI